MENKRMTGTCDYCGEQTDRLYNPPLLSVPVSELRDSGGPILEGDTIWWHAPGSAYGGKEPFEVIAIEGIEVTLRPPETSDRPVCWLCYAGALWPALFQWVANKPDEFEFRGYHDPTWKETAEPITTR